MASNGTQPKPWKYTSVQACALRLVMTYASPSCLSPRVKPNATRAGTPAARDIQASAAAYCWQ